MVNKWLVHAPLPEAREGWVRAKGSYRVAVLRALG